MLYSDLNNLFYVIGSVINNALSDIGKSEPQLVANLVWEIPRAINNLRFSNGEKITSGGVFVHAQPFVKCKNFPDQTKKAVEIGDLLLLRTEVSGEKITNRRALMLQAKKVSSYSIKPDNVNQHYLYATWPSFEYTRSTEELNGKGRCVTGLDLYNATRYLLINNTKNDHCCFCAQCYCFVNRCGALTASPTQPKLSHYRCFVEELVEFILGNAGKTFLKPSPRSRNWDRVIEDLTIVTAKRISKIIAQASGMSTQSRGQGQCFAFLSGDRSDVSLSRYGATLSAWKEEYLQKNSLNEPPEVPPGAPENGVDDTEEWGGISTIEFIVSSEEGSEPAKRF